MPKRLALALLTFPVFLGSAAAVETECTPSFDRICTSGDCSYFPPSVRSYYLDETTGKLFTDEPILGGGFRPVEKVDTPANPRWIISRWTTYDGRTEFTLHIDRLREFPSYFLARTGEIETVGYCDA